ncbi:DsbE family thiol:disulfide interchange protein [Vibrio ponticus]|uniref:DsbE family thiol:disulfide interchange protein n=1 Tax=Vibrio ponticus TaxID=265668 RepID=A0A3N3DWM9_9VIBR|nr:DsbE family thiol:disulfide interchange protein [Vibrio ponticus]ROV58780.1 DsbE family thiol:disulfide interchange protein [Vibrio ponticus]ROV61625.1 DsbE family thiol:disulfide interchange protein [Vibrio ponticus]
MFFSKHKVLIFILGLSAFITLLVLGVQAQRFGPQTQATVRQLPQHTVVTLVEQAELTSQSLLSEEYQVLNVWASWCGICRAEHHFLNQIANQGITVIGLNYRDNRGSALNYLAELGNPYQSVIFDPSGKLSIDLGVIGTPETYLVTQEGSIVYKHSGLLDQQAWDKFFAAYFVGKGES